MTWLTLISWPKCELKNTGIA